MGNYGFKVSQPGYDVKTATPSQLVFSSKYQTLKVQQQGSGAITDSGGRSVTVPHNLGYVPMFLVHSQIDPLLGAVFGSSTDYFISPLRYPMGACHVDRDVIAWADTTNLYIKVRPDFGWRYYYTGCNSVNYCMNDSTSGYFTGTCRVGKYIVTVFDGAIRFTGIGLSQGESFYRADFRFYIWDKDGDEVHMLFYGINEDNTVSFDQGTAGPQRPKTSASITWNTPPDMGEGQTFSLDVKAIVTEIIGRGGWSGGNAMGFILNNNETDQWHAFADNYSGGCGFYCSNSHLRILKSNTLMNYKYTIYLNQVNP